jgi:hypothetical protein
MRPVTLIPALALSLVATLGLTAQAHADCPVSIVTGVDVSASITPEELALQVDGIASAIQSPAVLSAIQSQGCARFAVYLWADGQPAVVLPWTDVQSQDDAAAVGQVLSQAASHYSKEIGTLTDVSGALEFSWALLNQTPPTGKQVVNLISNGTDNSGEGPMAASARMRAAGVVINAVLMGPAEDLEEYYRTNVTGGLGSFIMRIDASEDVAAAFRSKFILDLSFWVR